MIPASFQPAIWQGTTAQDSIGRVGITLLDENGVQHRFLLDSQSVQLLGNSLQQDTLPVIEAFGKFRDRAETTTGGEAILTEQIIEGGVNRVVTPQALVPEENNPAASLEQQSESARTGVVNVCVESHGNTPSNHQVSKTPQ